MDSACAVIQAAASEAEQESEDFAAEFTNGEISIDEFLKAFLPLRHKAHSLKLQSEKLLEEINKPTGRNAQRTAPPAPTGYSSQSYQSANQQQYRNAPQPPTYNAIRPGNPTPYPPNSSFPAYPPSTSF